MNQKPQSRRATSSPKTASKQSAPKRARLTFGRKAILIGILALVGLMFLPTISTGIRQAQQINALENDNAATQSEIRELQKKQRELKDPKHIERRAREDFHYTKSGEKLFIVESDSEEEAAKNQANKGDRKRPWYIELSDSLKTVGLATEE